ncbi:aspartyl-tRNA synthetase [Phellopilus nigrolimitatus]|nr:aspartyl-tRNA synthetase [Phellopilus nigrolimitatus]
MSEGTKDTIEPSAQETPKGPSKNELKKRAKEEEKARKAAERSAKEAEAAKAKAGEEDAADFAKQYYGKLPLNQSQERPKRTRDTIASLSEKLGQNVLLRARIQTSRAQGNKMVFLHLRQKIDTVQGLLVAEDGKISRPMVKWTAGLPDESIVLVEGIVEKPKEEIKSTTVKDVEVHINQIHLINSPEVRLPFTLDDASRAESENAEKQLNNVLLETRLNNRVLDLRTTTNQAVFKLQASITDFFREFLTSTGFTEIHTPKLQGAATESGASVFKVSYFKGSAFLAQSPQLAKQMAIASDFERVYEIGPVFRAEDSNTHRHLTEFIGLDLEMTIEEHYHEAMELLDQLFLSIFRNLKEKCQKEIDTVGRQFPAEEFKWREGPEGTLKLTFAQAVDLLVEDGVDRSVLDDINTENEKRLGRVVKKKYDTDYFIVDKFPMALRPFYTMPDPSDPKSSNSYDFFMRGEEILSGAQRVHEPQLLAQQMKDKGIDPESMKGYMDGFRLGCPPHGGGGIGLERVLMLYLKLNNIRRATLFPRDPKRLEP